MILLEDSTMSVDWTIYMVGKPELTAFTKGNWQVDTKLECSNPIWTSVGLVSNRTIHHDRGLTFRGRLYYRQ